MMARSVAQTEKATSRLPFACGGSRLLATRRLLMSTDKIVKTVVLDAPHDRVWSAIADSTRFGTWFGVDFAGQPFVAGATLTGRIVPTKVDPEVAKLQEP